MRSWVQTLLDCVLMYIMCMYIDVPCTYVFTNMRWLMNGAQNFFLIKYESK